MDKNEQAWRAARIVLGIPVRYRPVGDHQWMDSRVLNLSESGMLLGPVPLPAGVQLELAFVVPGNFASFAAGRVRCVGETVRRTPYGAVGVRFDECRYLVKG